MRIHLSSADITVQNLIISYM